jgi:hypothetical protein
MAHINTYKLKVSFRIFGKHWNNLTTKERKVVLDVVDKFY